MFVRRFAGRRIESRNRFVEFEPGRYVAFEIPDGAMPGRASYLVEPMGAGRCQLTSMLRFNVAGWMRIAEPLWRDSCDEAAATTSKTLKRLLETDVRSVDRDDRFGRDPGVIPGVGRRYCASLSPAVVIRTGLTQGAGGSAVAACPRLGRVPVSQGSRGSDA